MERSGGQKEEHEGERFLRLLGLEDLADREIATADGTIQGRDFLDLEACARFARPMLIGFEDMSPDHPEYETAREALRGRVIGYVEGDGQG